MFYARRPFRRDAMSHISVELISSFMETGPDLYPEQSAIHKLLLQLHRIGNGVSLAIITACWGGFDFLKR